MFNQIINLKTKTLKEKGAAAVEFALILIPLIVLIFAIFQFGIVFNNWIALTHAAREGARLSAVAEDETTVKEAVINRAPTVRISEADIIIDNPNIVGMPVTVTVTGEVINFELPLVGSRPILLTSSATLRVEMAR